MERFKFFLSIKLQLFIFCILIFLPIILISSYLFHQHTREILHRELENKLLSTAILASEKFKSENIGKLKNAEDSKSREYKEVKKNLVHLKKSFPFIKFISIVVRKNENTAFYVADSSSKPYDLNKDGKIFPVDEGFILLGDKAGETQISTDSDLEKGFSEPTISRIIYTDKTGSWLRAYSPIHNFGTSLYAVLIMDMHYNIKDENTKFMTLFERVLIISFLIILVLLFIGTRIFLFPIKKLGEKVNGIRKNIFTKKIPFSWIYGEIGDLVKSVNQMSDELKDHFVTESEKIEQLEQRQKVIEVSNQQMKSKNIQLNNTILTLNSINELIEMLISKRCLQDLMNDLLPSVTNLVKAKKAFVLEYDQDNKSFTVLSSFNTDVIKKQMEISISENQSLKKVLETINSVTLCEEGHIKNEKYENAIVFPLLLEKEVKGIMFIMNKEEGKDKKESTFEENDEAIVKILSKLAAAIWDSIHLFELASFDSLTQLYVRRYFEKNLDEELKKARRQDTNLSLIVLDIDDLKNYNEEYGYSIGDQIIKRISEKIREFVKENEIAARYGGEKLILLIPEKTAAEAFDIAENIRKSIENMEISSNEDKSFKITVSIGISEFPENGETVEELIKSADEALYKAKREGKNKVILSEN